MQATHTDVTTRGHTPPRRATTTATLPSTTESSVRRRQPRSRPAVPRRSRVLSTTSATSSHAHHARRTRPQLGRPAALRGPARRHRRRLRRAREHDPRRAGRDGRPRRRHPSRDPVGCAAARAVALEARQGRVRRRGDPARRDQGEALPRLIRAARAGRVLARLLARPEAQRRLVVAPRRHQPVQARGQVTTGASPERADPGDRASGRPGSEP